MDTAIEPSLGAALDPDDDALLEALPKEVGVFLILVGIGGILLPGPIGMPFFLMGGVILFPESFREVDHKFRAKFPEAHRQGMKRARRFAADLERRYPSHASS